MLEELENKMKIRELVDRFAALEINVHDQMDLFTDDCVVNIYFGNTIGMTMKGKEELEKAFSAGMAGVKSSHHANEQLLVEINGDEAKGTLYCTATLLSEEEGKDILAENYIVYNDVYKKVDGKWLIKERNSHFKITNKNELGK